MSCPEVIEVLVPNGPSVIEVVTPGPAGAQGPPGPQPEAYVHVQSTAATTWTINHNLEYRPSAELLDASSREIDGDVYHPTVNQTVVMFNVPVAGIARLI